MFCFETFGKNDFSTKIMFLLSEYSVYQNLITNLAQIATILQFLSGILVCKQYVTNKTTGDASPLPFLCGVLSAGLWLLYGIYKQDDNIIRVNAVGLTLMSAYLAVFYKYTIKKSTLLNQISICVVMALILLVYVVNESDYELLISLLGLGACSLTMITVGVPMTQLFHVIRVRNTACLPFPMILMSFFVTSLWMLYGLILVDYFIIVPNLVGSVLSALQLTLFMIYPSIPPSINKCEIL